MRNNHSISFIVIGITVLSLAIYGWGIKKNLPYSPEVDENFWWVGRAVQMAGTKSTNPGWFGHPGSTILYPLSILYRLQYGANVQQDFYDHPSNFYLHGRILVILYAILSVPLIYWVGYRVFGRSVGIIGSLFFIFYPLAIYNFQIIRSDSASVFFGTLSLWRILTLHQNPTFKNQILAGISIGLAISSRYFMAFQIPFLVLVNYFNLTRDPTKVKLRLKQSALGFLMIILSFGLTTPYFFLDFKTAMKDILGEGRSSHLGADGLSPIGNFLWYFTKAIPDAISWPQTLVFLVGCIFLFSKKKEIHLILLGYVLFFVVGISALSLHWARWVIPILPMIALIIAFAIDTLVNKVPIPGGLKPVLLGSTVIALLVWPASLSILHNIRESHPSTRIYAREWMISNLPGNSHILQEWYTALLDDTSFDVDEKFSLVQDIEAVDDYKSNFDYLIVSDWMYSRYFAESDRYPQETDFYNRLFNSQCLLKEFTGSTIQGGPTIRIYQIKDCQW